jgi:hypothetical protein
MYKAHGVNLSDEYFNAGITSRVLKLIPGIAIPRSQSGNRSANHLINRPIPEESKLPEVQNNRSRMAK